MRLLLISGVCAVMAATSAAATSLTDRYSSFWVFGDSLSDNGNLFALAGQPPAPYVDGRFSNGPVWNEGIIQDFTDNNGQLPVGPDPFIGLTYNGNFAFGGAVATGDNINAGLPDVSGQIGLFAQTALAVAGPTPLASLFFGANDIFQGLVVGTEIQRAQDAADAVVAGIGTLAFLGVQDFLVFNLPDIGITPSYFGTADQADATAATVEFNSRLAAGLTSFGGQLNISTVDTFSLFNDIADNPADFGATNATQACILNPFTCDPDTWLFWDTVHPTSLGHELLETAALDALTPVPLPATAPLYLFALAGAGFVARRKMAA